MAYQHLQLSNTFYQVKGLTDAYLKTHYQTQMHGYGRIKKTHGQLKERKGHKVADHLKTEYYAAIVLAWKLLI